MIRQVYFARVIGPHRVPIGAIKVGCSYEHDARLTAIASNQPYTLELLTAAPGDFISEAVIHLLFREHRISGEFFHENCVVMDYVEEVRERGTAFEYIQDHSVGYEWLPAAATQAFMDYHGLTTEGVCRRLGRSPSAFLGKPAAMANRKFVAAALLEAVWKQAYPRFVRWPTDCIFGLLGQRHPREAPSLPEPDDLDAEAA